MAAERAKQTHGPSLHASTQYIAVGPDERTVSVRAATLQDKEKLREMFYRLSPKTIQQRFHHGYPRVPDLMLDLMLDVDRDYKESLFALVGEEIVGHVMYVRSDTYCDAEVAFVVEDRWQSKGVGKLLLFEIAQKARLRGVETFTGEVLRGNERVLGLLNAVFAEVGYAVGYGLYHFRVPLGILKPTAVRPLRILDAPRKAGRGSILQILCC
jgi:GNAT superfamily N-acetyltransferase